LEQSDEVLIPAPYWVSYPDNGDVYRRYSCAGDDRSSDGFACVPKLWRAPITAADEAADRQFAEQSERGGRARDEFARIYEVCRAKSIWLLTDECYSPFRIWETKSRSRSRACGHETEYHRCRSLSKTFAMTAGRGLRAGARRADLRDDQAASQSHFESNSIASSGARKR